MTVCLSPLFVADADTDYDAVSDADHDTDDDGEVTKSTSRHPISCLRGMVRCLLGEPAFGELAFGELVIRLG